MVAIFLLAIGAMALVAGVTLTFGSLKARSWPVVSGRVVEKSVGPSTTTGASRPGRYFEPRVKYLYTVEGKSYTGARIGLVTAAYGEDQAQRVVNNLPETVEVRYNPRDPGDAYLQPSSFGLAVVCLLTGVVGALIGAGLLFTKKG